MKTIRPSKGDSKQSSLFIEKATGEIVADEKCSAAEKPHPKRVKAKAKKQ